MNIKSKYLGKTHVVDGNGKIITAQVVRKEVPKNYWKVSIENLIASLGNMTPKAMYVVDYVLRNTDFRNNSFIGTNKAISKGCKKVGYTKVATTLSFLASHDVITRKPGVIMWNPKIVNHKTKDGVPDLIIRYRTMTHEYKSVKSSTEANKKRTAKARKVRARNRRISKAPKDWHTYPSKAEAKRRHAAYQLKLGKIKKPAKNN